MGSARGDGHIGEFCVAFDHGQANSVAGAGVHAGLERDAVHVQRGDGIIGNDLHMVFPAGLQLNRALQAHVVHLRPGPVGHFLEEIAVFLALEGEIVCVGIGANMNFIIICTYELDGANPELIIYKKR